MKYISFVLSFLLIAGCAHVSGTSSPVNINGTWEGVYENKRVKTHDVFEMFHHPPMHLIFNFKSDGVSLKGNVYETTTEADELISFENGKIKGKKIYFKGTTVPKNGKPEITYDFKGKVAGDKIEMTFKYEIHGEYEWNELFYPSRRYRFEYSEELRGRKLKESLDDDEGERLRDHYWSYESMDRLMFQSDRLNSRSGDFIITRVQE